MRKRDREKTKLDVSSCSNWTRFQCYSIILTWLEDNFCIQDKLLKILCLGS